MKGLVSHLYVCVKIHIIVVGVFSLFNLVPSIDIARPATKLLVLRVMRSLGGRELLQVEVMRSASVINRHLPYLGHIPLPVDDDGEWNVGVE